MEFKPKKEYVCKLLSDEGVGGKIKCNHRKIK